MANLLIPKVDWRLKGSEFPWKLQPCALSDYQMNLQKNRRLRNNVDKPTQQQ